jgi:dihydroorotase
MTDAEHYDNFVVTGANYAEPGGPARPRDVAIEHGTVTVVSPRPWSEKIAAVAGRPRTLVVDGTGSFLAPGFIDLHVHLREPGQAEKETITSGAEAAAAGGFTTVVAMANTSPPVDDVATLEAVLRRARGAAVRVLPVAAVTKDLAGRELTDFEALANRGAVAFSDDGRHAYDLELMVAAVRRAAVVDRPVLVHAQDESACPDGQVDTSVARAAGLKPWPCDAEASVVATAIEACREGGGRVHIQHVSCAASVALVREARRAGLPVTAEVTPHHLMLTARRVLGARSELDPMAKVNPPLRGERDREALVAGLAERVIDAVATDHAPHDAASKEVPFVDASFGISGLETALSLCLELVDTHQLSLSRLVESLTLGPWSCLPAAAGIPQPGIRPGETADLVLFNTHGIWTVDPRAFLSHGHNTPLAGREMLGRVLLTVAAGRPVTTRWFAGAA